MFSSRSLHAVVPPGALAVRAQRLGDAVHVLEVRGTLDAATVPELSRRIDAAAAAGGVRWLIVDLAGAESADDAALAELERAARELPGELIVTGVARPLAVAQLASVDEAVMVLKGGAQPRAKQRVAALMLPRIE